jgi:hypothetical protein
MEPCEKRGVVSKQKRRGKREKTHQVAAASCHVFVSRRVLHCEKGGQPPLTSVSERVPYAPVRESSQRRTRKKKKKER